MRKLKPRDRESDRLCDLSKLNHILICKNPKTYFKFS